MGIHPASGAVTPFNGGRIGRGVPPMVERLLNTTLRTMDIADVHGHEALSFPMLDDLHMSQRPGDAVAQFGKASPIPLATGPIGLAEDLWEQAGITGFAIRKQDQVVTIRKPLRRIPQQASDQRLIPPTLDMRHHKLTLRINNSPYAPKGLTSPPDPLSEFGEGEPDNTMTRDDSPRCLRRGAGGEVLRKVSQ